MEASARPIRLVINDDFARSRLTVFFRVLLMVPHIFWWALWSVLALLTMIVNWFATLFTGRSPLALHNFLARYLRYSVHINAFALLAANTFPGFTGAPGTYPVDLEIDPPQPQNRWKTFFRSFLVLPAAILAGSIGGAAMQSGISSSGLNISVASSAAIFAWFACLARARMPTGLGRAIDFGIAYSAQVSAYTMLLTDRYPSADPLLVTLPPSDVVPPVRVRDRDDGVRSQLTVFFRLILAIPHLILRGVWSYAVALIVFFNWFAVLFTGSSPPAFHQFISAYVRYDVRVVAYATLLADPFPGVIDAEGSYPIEAILPPAPQPQSRWRTFFRLPMMIPAWFLMAGFFSALFVVAICGWFASLFTAREPRGLQRLGVWALAYYAQFAAFAFLLTDSYPYTGPESVLYEGPPQAEPVPLPPDIEPLVA